MATRLSDDQIKAYRRDGFVHPVRVLDADTAASYRARFAAYEKQQGGWYALSKGQKIYLLQTWAAELASHAAVLDAVEGVLGPDLFVWGVSLFVKDAGDGAYVSWHQDATYWGLNKPDVATAWIALSSATQKSGCMKMLPGSHKWAQQPHSDTLAEKNLLTRGQEIDVAVDEDKAVALEMGPGEMSLHHIMTAHSSGPNQSDDRRIAVAIRYVAPDVAQINGERDGAWLVRGEDRFGNFVHETPPKADMDPAAMAEHKRIMELRQSILYQGVAGKPARI
ncbi:MAG: phytanoyl-CoA dioxygenase family protein [Proteobacteria bacterium]|nr:phytanoyl-CoA dioxygenase family protein [Pseudomonadota bacterium]